MTGQLDLLDPRALAGQAERGLTLAELAGAVMDETDRDNTLRAFRGDWDRWTRFRESVAAAGFGEQLDGSSDALVVFAKWLAEGGTFPDGHRVRPHAPESIRRRLTGVLYGWREHDVNYPRGVTKQAREWIDDYQEKLIERRQPIGRGKAPALTIDDIRKIAATCPPTLAGRRDLALVLMAFSIGGRQSELAFLDVPDIEPHESGMYVHIRRSKTGARKPKVKFGEHDDTCPVLAWRRWQETSGIITGAAFRTVDRHDNLGDRMSGQAVSDALGRAGKRAGVTTKLTGHSARRGLATAARKAGRSVEKIADQGGWRRNSYVLQGYIDDVDGWTDNVLAGIGL